MRKGNILVYGVGINDSDEPTQTTIYGEDGKKILTICPFYRRWTDMLRRCYSINKNARNSSYVDCHVCDEWKKFSKFKIWMEAQDWQGKHLDKDILFPFNKIYSPETCVFVSGNLNKFLIDRSAGRGELPPGVTLNGSSKYQACCRNPFTGQQERLGVFDNPDSAHEAWRERKHLLACKYAELQDDIRVVEALKTRFICEGDRKIIT